MYVRGHNILLAGVYVIGLKYCVHVLYKLCIRVNLRGNRTPDPWHTSPHSNAISQRQLPLAKGLWSVYAFKLQADTSDVLPPSGWFYHIGAQRGAGTLDRSLNLSQSTMCTSVNVPSTCPIFVSSHDPITCTCIQDKVFLTQTQISFNSKLQSSNWS